MPDAGITTDVIVGYPGETEADFEETLELLDDLRFDKVHTAAYSPRPGTIADRTMPDDIPAEVKSERLQAVNALEERISREINASLLGTTQTILVEGVSKKGQHYGRTRTGKLVHLDAPARTGALVDVRIDHAGPFALRGCAVDALAVVG